MLPAVISKLLLPFCSSRLRSEAPPCPAFPCFTALHCCICSSFLKYSLMRRMWRAPRLGVCSGCCCTWRWWAARKHALIYFSKSSAAPQCLSLLRATTGSSTFLPGLLKAWLTSSRPWECCMTRKQSSSNLSHRTSAPEVMNVWNIACSSDLSNSFFYRLPGLDLHPTRSEPGMQKTWHYTEHLQLSAFSNSAQQLGPLMPSSLFWNVYSSVFASSLGIICI